MGLGNYFTRPLAALLNSSVVLARDVPMPDSDKQKIADRAARAAYEKAFRQATAMLMTGPRATPPRRNTVLRMMRLLRAGGPSIKGALIKRGDVLWHPTKGRRSA